MGVLISHTLSEIHFHNYIVIKARIKFLKHLEHSQEILIKNIKYFPPTHFSIVKDRLFKKIDEKIIDENGIPQQPPHNILKQFFLKNNL